MTQTSVFLDCSLYLGKPLSARSSAPNVSSSKVSRTKTSGAKTSGAKTSGAKNLARGVNAGPKRPCRVTVTAPGWEGARVAAIAAGCSSVSDMLEKLGSGELSVISSDAMLPELEGERNQAQISAQISEPASGRILETLKRSVSNRSDRTQPPAATTAPQHIHIHTPTPTAVDKTPSNEDSDPIKLSDLSIPRLAVTGLCAFVIVGSLLYIANRIIDITTDAISPRERVEDIITPKTGDVVAGFEVSDEYGIRPFHPVTGAPNVPHNGVDLATPIGTPIYAVGKAGDQTSVKCWWDIDGGGWVVNQTADSYPGYVFQSLHMSENGCREGQSMAGEVIAYSGNSGLGTGEHYDFRVKIDGEYVPPATKYLESAMTGEPPKD